MREGGRRRGIGKAACRDIGKQTCFVPAREPDRKGPAGLGESPRMISENPVVFFSETHKTQANQALLDKKIFYVTIMGTVVEVPSLFSEPSALSDHEASTRHTTNHFRTDSRPLSTKTPRTRSAAPSPTFPTAPPGSGTSPLRRSSASPTHPFHEELYECAS